jgi:peptide/nickel transport system permease protein
VNGVWLLVVRRLALLVVVILLVSLLTLWMLQLLPGGPADAILGTNATEEQVARVEAQLHLDEPFIQQYGRWLAGIVTLDLGESIATKESVMEIITSRMGVTLELAGLTLLVSLLVAVPAATYAGYRKGGWFDRVLMFFGSLFMSVPSFLAALLLVYFLAVVLGWLPVNGWVPISHGLIDHVRHIALPVITLALLQIGLFVRILRNDVVATMQENYILAVRARGLPMRQILPRHVLKPSALPLVTVAGVSLGQLVGGAVIVETIFGLPGLGQLALTAINNRDFIVLRGTILVISVGYVLVNTVVDLIYPALDPRVRERPA